MIPRVFTAVLAAGICSLTGCLEFGADTELLAPNVTLQHIQQVSSLTGIQFPDGSTGLAYYYLGSGIDDALALKVAIREDKKEAFLQNETPRTFRLGSPRRGGRSSLSGIALTGRCRFPKPVLSNALSESRRGSWWFTSHGFPPNNGEQAAGKLRKDLR
jgi:hypothetical protein